MKIKGSTAMLLEAGMQARRTVSPARVMREDDVAALMARLNGLVDRVEGAMPSEADLNSVVLLCQRRLFERVDRYLHPARLALMALSLLVGAFAGGVLVVTRVIFFGCVILFRFSSGL